MSDFPWVEADWLQSPQARRYGALVGDPMVTVRRYRLDAARDWLLSGGSVLFFGPGEAGKTAALDVVVAGARNARVLRGAPVWPDTVSPYGALAGLLSSVTDAEFGALATARREALDRVTGRGQDRAAAVDPDGVGRAVVDLFRSLSRTRQLVLVLDGLEWVDEPSAEVLRFTAAYVEELPVRMVAAERVAGGVLPRGRGMCPSPLLAVRLDALIPN